MRARKICLHLFHADAVLFKPLKMNGLKSHHTERHVICTGMRSLSHQMYCYTFCMDFKKFFFFKYVSRNMCFDDCSIQSYPFFVCVLLTPWRRRLQTLWRDFRHVEAGSSVMWPPWLGSNNWELSVLNALIQCQHTKDPQISSKDFYCRKIILQEQVQSLGPTQDPTQLPAAGQTSGWILTLSASQQSQDCLCDISWRWALAYCWLYLENRNKCTPVTLRRSALVILLL